MYVQKNFDSASSMWDYRILLEMQDFYKKRKQGELTDTILTNRVKRDIGKFYKQLSSYSFDKFLDIKIATEDTLKIAFVSYKHTLTLKGIVTTEDTMLILISEDNGKSWLIQDWTIKWIADQIDKKLF
ncbi:hypothetical protein [Microcoleus sp. F10-A1]|uniref:hypothetical protein n=1 Tax=Microcoleus sp. F10-A1 TaxID=2818750 RepID=UPI002FD1606F